MQYVNFNTENFNHIGQLTLNLSSEAAKLNYEFQLILYNHEKILTILFQFFTFFSQLWVFLKYEILRILVVLNFEKYKILQ